MVLKLSANHRRAISTTLTMLDELLVGVEKWVDGSQYHSILYEEKNDINSLQRKALKKQISVLRDHLVKIKSDIGIEKTSQSAINDIWSRVSAFRENIMELEAKHMKKYGQLTQESQDYMNRLSRNLLFQLDRMLEIIKE